VKIRGPTRQLAGGGSARHASRPIPSPPHPERATRRQPIPRLRASGPGGGGCGAHPGRRMRGTDGRGGPSTEVRRDWLVAPRVAPLLVQVGLMTSRPTRRSAAGPRAVAQLYKPPSASFLLLHQTQFETPGGITSHTSGDSEKLPERRGEERREGARRCGGGGCGHGSGSRIRVPPARRPARRYGRAAIPLRFLSGVFFVSLCPFMWRI
jgi:hypothetical protein